MTTQAPREVICWGTEYCNHLNAQFELFKTVLTQGFSYNLQCLIADFLCHVLQHDPIFNPTNSHTFNSNYRNWAMRYQTGLEYAEICPAAFERQPKYLVVCYLLLSSLSNHV
tara:strand:+ start:228 stop:563 length:336 start_codon:yes stop_codon:yes gene_type:complete